MIVRLETLKGSVVEVFKDVQYGFVLTYTPKSEENKNGMGTKVRLFYPNLKQVAEKLVWLELSGEGVDDIIKKMGESVELIADKLEAYNLQN